MIRPQMAGNYGPQRGPGIPGMAQAMGMGRFRDPYAGQQGSGRGQDMARMAVGSAPSDQIAAAFMRALGGTPSAGGGAMPGLSGGYQDELKRLAFALQNHGRMGDTVLAHINPREARMLHENTDGGSINPQTGLLEFWSDGAGGPGGQGGQDSGGMGGGGGSDGGSDSGFGGDFGGDGSIGSWGGVNAPGLPSLGEAAEVGPAPGAGRPSVAAAPGGPDLKGTSMDPGTGKDPGYPGGPTGSYSGTPGTVGRSGVPGVNTSGYGFNPNMGQSLVEGLVSLIGPGAGLTRAAQWAGIESDAKRDGKPDAPPESGPGGSDTSGPGSSFVKPTVTASTLSRPAAMDAPSFLDFESDDPLQRRAKIATFATQGGGGKWATDEAFDYWKNLTQRGLISDAGQMPDFANLLGTELGYLGSRGIAAPNQTRALLEAILSA